MTLNLTTAPTTHTEPVSTDSSHPHRLRRTVAGFAIGTVAVAGAAFLSVRDTDSPPPSAPASTRPASVMDSPDAFDRAVADAVRVSDDSDSVLLDGDAFDRAVAQTTTDSSDDQ